MTKLLMVNRQKQDKMWELQRVTDDAVLSEISIELA